MDKVTKTFEAPKPAPVAEVKPEDIKENNYTVPAEDTPAGQKGAN